jgi:hypothetical protein
MHAVLYHHGCPQSRKLLTLEHREWITGLTLPAAARCVRFSERGRAGSY